MSATGIIMAACLSVALDCGGVTTSGTGAASLSALSDAQRVELKTCGPTVTYDTVASDLDAIVFFSEEHAGALSSTDIDALAGLAACLHKSADYFRHRVEIAP